MKTKAGNTKPDIRKARIAAFVLLVSGFSLLAFAPAAQAACTSGGNAGDIMYNGAKHVIQYCDGANWWPMGQSGGTSGLTCSSNFINGEFATDILGQFNSPSSDTTADYVKSCVNDGASQIGLSAPAGSVIDAVNHRLYMMDAFNNRLLVYTLTSGNLISSKTPAYVLGQPDFISCGPLGPTQSGFYTQNDPSAPGLAFDPVNNRLFVMDAGDSRVLVFNTSSLSNGMNASYVLGKPDFTSNGGSTTQSGLSTGGDFLGSGIAFDSANQLLYVSDNQNNRVMVFNVAPSYLSGGTGGACSSGTYGNGENACYELGQPSGVNAFTTATAATTQSGLSDPAGLALDSTNQLLYVADYNNARVMVFPTSSLANGENASYVLGAPDFVTNTGGVTTQSGMGSPDNLAFDSVSSRLFVGDTLDDRVLVFNTASISNGMNASYVLGQADFNSGMWGCVTTQSGLCKPSGLTYDSTNTLLYVSDIGNNRVMEFNAPPSAGITNGENANDLLGQFNSPSVDTTDVFTKNCGNDGASPLGLSGPHSTAIDATNHRLFVADNGNSRVLVYNLTSGNLLSSKTPAYVLGQSSFTVCGAQATSSSTMNVPQGLAFDAVNNRLFVADQGNNRVLVFNTTTITSGMAASYELGQPSGTAFTSNATATTQSGLNATSTTDLGFELAFDSTHEYLYVADGGNNRVLVFNVATGSIANGENATYVLGQSSWTTATAATTQTGMSNPTGVALDTTHNYLYVSDLGNYRVMVFPTSSLANNENASFVLGQSSFTTGGAGGATQSGFGGFGFGTTGLAVDPANSRLFVTDTGNSRVMVFPTSSLANNEPASYLLGQPIWTDGNGGTNQSTLNWTDDVAYDSTNNQLYVSDSGNNRIMLFNTNPTPPTVSAATQSGNDACAIGNGALYCWGVNNSGEDGVGLAEVYGGSCCGLFIFPLPVGTATNWTSISQGDPAQDSAACGIAGGALYCWGDNNYGESGLGNTNLYDTPQQVGSDTTWTAISHGGTDACGIDNGSLYCWGLNNVGESGLGNSTQHTTPQQVGALTTWTAISQSGFDACGITAGSLYCWGNNAHGEVGNSGTAQQTSPVHIGSDTTWTAISQGAYDTCGIDNGKLYCWGWNQYGELGLNNTTQKTSPQQVGADTTWTAVSVRNDGQSNGNACGIDNGALYCWGLNKYGELGLGNTTQFKTPQQVGSATNWTAVSVGNSDVCGIGGGALYCWGANGNGEDGVGNTTQYKTPQAVAIGGISAENATDELGQYTSPSSAATVDYTQNGPNNGPTALGLNWPNGVALDSVNHRLFVSDYNNNRVLVYNLNTDNSFPASSGGHTASYVLGQPNLQGDPWAPLTQWGSTTQSTMQGPEGLAYDATNNRLFVADTYNNRVMVWNVAPGSIANGENASYELGQPNFFSTSGATTTATGLSAPMDVAYDSAHTLLYVADTGNNRVMVFNVANGAIANGESASYELGHTSGGAAYTTATANNNTTTNSAGLNGPMDVAFDAVNSRLFVSDLWNNRVLVFSTGAISNGMAAAHVLGQTGFAGNAGACAQSGLNFTGGLSYDATNSRLFVVNTECSDVMEFNVALGSIADGENADYEIGAANFGGATFGLGQAAMNLNSGDPQFIAGLAYDATNGRLFVADTVNNRVLEFSAAVPTGLINDENASDEIGQYTSPASTATVTWTKGGGNNGPTALGLSASSGEFINPALDAVNHRLFVADHDNNRVLVYNLNPDNSLPASSGGHTATYVLGQPDFTSNGDNGNVPTQAGFNQPMGVAYDATNNRLFVADFWNNRVLVFNTSSLSNGMNASVVLGEPDFVTNSGGVTTQAGMHYPLGVAYDATNNRLFVADGSNNRVLVYNSGSISNGHAADIVLGQTTWTANGSGVTSVKMNAPHGVAYDATNNRLFVADYNNSRVMVFNSGSISNGHAADNVLGQTSFTANGTATTPTGMNSPKGVAFDATNNRLFVADTNNQRVTLFNTASITNGEAASYVFGEPDFNSAGQNTTQAGMDYPTGIAYDAANNRLFVEDSGNNRVLVFPPHTSCAGGGSGCAPPTVPSNGLVAWWKFDETSGTIAKDSSGNGDDGTLISGPTWTTGKINGALSFNGATQYVNVPDAAPLNIAGAWTVSTWVKLSSLPPSWSVYGLITRLSTAENENYALYVDAGNGPCGCGNASPVFEVQFAYGSGTNVYVTYTPPGGILANTWYHVTGTWNGTTLTLYVNGVSVATTVPGAVPDGSSGTSLQIGDSSGYASYTAGTLDDLRIYARALSAGEVTALYNATSPAAFNEGDLMYNSDYHVPQYCNGVQWLAMGPIGVGGGGGCPMPANGQNAIDALGQFASTSSDATVVYTTSGTNDNNGATVGALGFSAPASLALDATNHRLFVADKTNNRVLVYNLNADNSIPVSPGHTASYVLGQPDFTHNAAATTQAGMQSPSGVAFDAVNNRLFVADNGNSRVLVFNTATITNGMNAAYELGQTAGGTQWTTATQATSVSGMHYPSSVAVDATSTPNRLFVVDSNNNRVLVFNVAPGTIANGENASNELGQPSGTAFTSATAATTQAGMSGPSGVAYDATNNRLFVVEDGNDRVTVFNTATITNGMNAANVLGQTLFTTATGNLTQAGMFSPVADAFDATNNRLFVTDISNNRVTVYNTATITNGMNASNVLGQANFGSGSGATTQAGMSGPGGVAYDATNNRLFVADGTNNRVTVYITPASPEGAMMYNSDYGVVQYCNGTNWMKIGSHSQ